MKKGRPARANTIYKVSIHNNGGRKYASTQPFTVDENGKKHYSHKHWGIVDDNMKFQPNSTYFYAIPILLRCTIKTVDNMSMRVANGYVSMAVVL